MEYKDPVCGMSVKAESPWRTSCNGTEYRFCCESCLKKFTADPEKFLNPEPATGSCAVPEPDAVYVCPMCPEVRELTPVPCPVCGMALEKKYLKLPAGAAADDDGKTEYRTLLQKLVISGILTAALMALMHVNGRMSGVLQLILCSVILACPAFFLIQRGINSLKTGKLNMFTLITLGMGTAYIFSLYALILPQTLPAAMLRRDGSPYLYFESSAMIATLIILGQLLEAGARKRTGSAIRALLSLAPPEANLVMPCSSVKVIPLHEVRPGDILRVKPGEKIPVDGIVISGSGTVNESMLTGEPFPVVRGEGKKVSAGTLNQQGSFDMKAEKVGSDTLLARIISLVEEARNSRAPVQKLADKVSAVFVPAVIGVSLLTFTVWTFFCNNLNFGLTAAIAVLLVACPCVLGMATPMSVAVGIGAGARQGILIRNAEAMELMHKVDVVLFDKTGTLTVGKPAVSGIFPAPGESEENLLAICAAGERFSNHPLASAVTGAAEERGLALPDCENFMNHPGEGISMTVNGVKALAGNAGFISKAGIKPVRSQSDNTGTEIFVAFDGRFLGSVQVKDQIKKGAAMAVATLKDRHVEPSLLTGDNEQAAAAVAEKLGIDYVISGALPQKKFEVVKNLQVQGRKVAMAGDGINDAAALAQADVGIAMGGGSDAAMQSAGITLVSGDISGVAKAFRLSEEMNCNIRQNLFFAFVYNIVMIPLAAGLFYPLTGILISPVISSVMMSLSSLSVIGNALRLRLMKF